MFMALEGSVLHEGNMTKQLSPHQERRVEKQKRQYQPSAHFPLFKFYSSWAPSSQMVFALQLIALAMLSWAPLVLGDSKPN